MKCNRLGVGLRRILSAVALLGLFPLGACARLEDNVTADVAFSENTNRRKVTLPGDMPTFDLLTDCMPAHLEPVVLGSKVYECKTPTIMRFNEPGLNTPEKAVMRNRFQDYLLWRSEQQCERHKAGILSTQSTTNFTLNTVTTGTAAIAGIVLAPATSILAAIAAISSGTRAHFNEDFYRQFLAPAVLKRINTDRANKYAEIMGKRGLQVIERPAGTVTAVSARTDGVSTVVVAKGPDPSPARTTPATTVVTTSTTTSNPTVVDPTTNTASVTTTTTDSTINYGGTRRVVLLQDYSIEEALADVERYHQLCSFSSGLASLVNPGEKYEDTSKGIQARIEALRDMQTANEKQAAALITSTGNPSNESARRLRDVNDDISRQIMVLQHRMLTAPMMVDSKPTGGG